MRTAQKKLLNDGLNCFCRLPNIVRGIKYTWFRHVRKMKGSKFAIKNLMDKRELG